MMFSTTTLTAIIMAILAVAIYFLQRPQSGGNFKSMESQFATRTLQPAVAFTYDKDEDSGQYLNYYTKLQKTQLENAPLTLPRGIPWTRDELHGQIYDENDHGFKIRGISTSFTCPTNTVWNSKQKICVSESTKCEYDGMILPYLNDEGQAHEKLYIYCTVSGYQFRECPFGSYFDQNRIACVPYDVCKNELSGFAYKINSGLCFVCNGGKGVQIDCNSPKS